MVVSSVPASSRQAVFPTRDEIVVEEQTIPETGSDELLLRVALFGVCATKLPPSPRCRARMPVPGKCPFQERKNTDDGLHDLAGARRRMAQL
ncbi:hypothetical protein [Luethyella okanaganae]|uniref:Uncharacterized protein n=1 Tax=Luethyella okanaganae TaxID=69372 RepID=A0ABW1VAG2_9MICO